MGKAFFGGGKAGMKKPSTSRLPSGYTELEYIQSSGTQWINTKFVPNNNTKIEAEIIALNNANDGVFFYGGGYSPSRIEAYPWDQTIQMHFGSAMASPCSLTANQRFRICQDKAAYSWTYLETDQNYSGSVSAQSFTCQTPLAIFALNRSSVILPSGGMKLFYFKIYDNGTLVRDFVPCISDADGVGLFDLVNNQFYGNAGSGSFIGSEVAA